MNLLVTGLPHSGKSTLLKKIIRNQSNKKGFITQEILENKSRIGFEIVTSTEKRATLASTKKVTSNKVSKYFVDILALDTIIPELQTIRPSEFLYIDEIGQMELISIRFKKLVIAYLDASNIFVGTLSSVYSDDFTKMIKKRTDITIFELKEDNREEIYNNVQHWIESAL